MAKKPTVTTILAGFASNTQLNGNFVALRDAFDNTLSLDGSTPNAMNADLDLNSNDVLNVNELDTTALSIGGVRVQPNTLQSLSSEALTSSGAVSTAVINSTLDTTSGAVALTLADGASGQMKNIVMVSYTGDAVLTPANFGNGSTITFNSVGDSCQLIFLASTWWIISNNNCTVA